jgi:glutamine synthetase
MQPVLNFFSDACGRLSRNKEQVEKDVYLLNAEEKAKEGITSLPGSLIEAIGLTEESELVREALGDHVFNNFITSKKVEWDNYRVNVTEWELKAYLGVL